MVPYEMNSKECEMGNELRLLLLPPVLQAGAQTGGSMATSEE